jgi:hypothetical protein
VSKRSADAPLCPNKVGWCRLLMAGTPELSVKIFAASNTMVRRFNDANHR